MKNRTNLLVLPMSINPAIIKIGVELEFYSFSSLAELQRLVDENFSLIYLVKEEEGKETENGQQQFEVLTRPSANFAAIIEEINKFKELTKAYNNFASKPFLDKPGSAIHIHISLHDSKTDANLLNTEAKIKLYIIGGLCEYIKPSMIYFAPDYDCYKRFQYYDMFTPRFTTWGFAENKTNSIRITNNTIEHRVPSSNANIEAVLNIILYALKYGIENKVNPPKANFGFPKYSEYVSQRIPLTLLESRQYQKAEILVTAEENI